MDEESKFDDENFIIDFSKGMSEVIKNRLHHSLKKNTLRIEKLEEDGLLKDKKKMGIDVLKEMNTIIKEIMDKTDLSSKTNLEIVALEKKREELDNKFDEIFFK